MNATWVSPTEAADELSVSIRTLQNMVKRGEVQRRRVGRRSEYLVAPVASVASVPTTPGLDDRIEELEELVRELADRVDELELEFGACREEIAEESRELGGRLDELETDDGTLDDLGERVDDLNLRVETLEEAAM